MITDKSTEGFELLAEKLNELNSIVIPLGGQFLLDPNEYNGWGILGPYDNSNTQDLGNVGAVPNRVAGGFCFPYDVKLVRFYAWHYNSSSAAEAWGWRILRQEKNDASNVVSFVNLLDEIGDNGGIGPRDYGNTTNQLTDVDLSANGAIPAGEVVVLGTEAPTAVGTNYYSRILSGYFEFHRV